eukprot:162280_1
MADSTNHVLDYIVNVRTRETAEAATELTVDTRLGDLSTSLTAESQRTLLAEFLVPFALTQIKEVEARHKLRFKQYIGIQILTTISVVIFILFLPMVIPPLYGGIAMGCSWVGTYFLHQLLKSITSWEKVLPQVLECQRENLKAWRDTYHPFTFSLIYPVRTNDATFLHLRVTEGLCFLGANQTIFATEKGDVIEPKHVTEEEETHESNRDG